jgi:FKBP-type peptidyl-prolyl cis-trans isomerase SlyD
MPIASGDFVEIEYTGKTDTGDVFDTTDENVAKQAGLTGGHARYGPQIICVGKGHVLRGIDTWLVGKDSGAGTTLILKPEDAFGKKNAKLIQMVPTKRFIEQQVRPEPGMPVNIDGMYGIIKTVTGGRTVVDFNHPLANKDITYDLKINAIITDKAKQIEALCTMHHLHGATVSWDTGNETATIKLPGELPKQIQDAFTKEITAMTGAKHITFTK